MNASYNPPWFTVSYLPKFADKFKEIIHSLDTRLSFCSLNKLGGIIKTHKDIFPKLSNKDVVYVKYAAKIVTLLMLDRHRDS